MELEICSSQLDDHRVNIQDAETGNTVIAVYHEDACYANHQEMRIVNMIVEMPNMLEILEKLSSTEGIVSILDGIMTFEDGSYCDFGEILKRIAAPIGAGQEFIYLHPDPECTDENDLADLSGKSCTVVREILPPERDEEVGQMFEVSFEEGITASVFADELYPEAGNW